jgi:hypothetical protein
MSVYIVGAHPWPKFPCSTHSSKVCLPLGSGKRRQTSHAPPCFHVQFSIDGLETHPKAGNFLVQSLAAEQG